MLTGQCHKLGRSEKNNEGGPIAKVDECLDTWWYTLNSLRMEIREEKSKILGYNHNDDLDTMLRDEGPKDVKAFTYLGGIIGK